MARSKAGYSGMLQEVGAKGENVEERVEMTKRKSRAPLRCDKVGVREAQKEVLEAIQAMLRRKTIEARTDKHRNVKRKLVVEGGWVQKGLYDIGWSDEKKCRGCNKEEGTEKKGLYHCLCWRVVRNLIPEKQVGK